MFVHLDARDRGEVNNLAGVQHDFGQIRCFFKIHSTKIDSHEKSRHLIIGDRPIQISPDKKTQLFRGEFFTSALFPDDFEWIQIGSSQGLLACPGIFDFLLWIL